MWASLKKMYFKYGDVDSVYSVKETCVRQICTKLTYAHDCFKLKLPKNLTSLIAQSFRVFKFYQFIEMEKDEFEYLEFGEPFLQFTPKSMSYVLTMDPDENSTFIPKGDMFCAVGEWYQDQYMQRYCCSCATVFKEVNNYLNWLHDTDKTYFQFKHVIEHEVVEDRVKAFDDYIFNQEMWCTNCAVSNLFMFSSFEDCSENLHRYKRKCVNFK